MLSFDAMKSWSTELKEMNHKKEGNRYQYPESFMEALGYVHLYLGLPYRQTEGLINSPTIQNKNTNIFSNLEKSKQTGHQVQSQTGKGHRHCN